MNLGREKSNRVLSVSLKRKFSRILIISIYIFTHIHCTKWISQSRLVCNRSALCISLGRIKSFGILCLIHSIRSSHSTSSFRLFFFCCFAFVNKSDLFKHIPHPPLFCGHFSCFIYIHIYVYSSLCFFFLLLCCCSFSHVYINDVCKVYEQWAR